MVAPTQTRTQQRPRYNEEDLQGLTLMSDPRVIRGSTHSLYRDDSLPAAGSALDAVARRRPRRRRAKKREPTVFEKAQVPAPRYVPLDLTPYLTEREEQRSTTTASEQTDGFLEQPPPAPYVPPKTGIDVETDMTESQPFDEGREGEAMLVDVLVEKTLEQALLEAEQEHELEGIQARNDELTAAKRAEEAKVRALEKATVDDEAQKLSDLEYHKQRLARERDLARKIGAVEFMAQNVDPIFESAFQHFESRGAWPDPVEYEIRKEFLPSLVDQVAEQLQGEMLLAQKVLDDVIQGRVDSSNYHPELEPPKPPPPPEEPAEPEEGGDDDAPPPEE